MSSEPDSSSCYFRQLDWRSAAASWSAWRGPRSGSVFLIEEVLALNPHSCQRGPSFQMNNSNAMELISSRTIPALDAESLLLCYAKEALFRDKKGFLLYLSKEVPAASTEERLVRLATREALVWLNEAPQDQGSFWS